LDLSRHLPRERRPSGRVESDGECHCASLRN
jgi:hypothetical protein